MSTTPESTDLLALHQRRPAWMEQKIDFHFLVASMRRKPYANNGVRPDYPFNNGRYYKTSIMKRALSKELGRPLRVLDIGAGVGAFVLQSQREGHVAQALTAQDTVPRADITKQLAPGTYVVGDANRMAAIPELEPPYDLIVSRFAFMHLVDPLGSLEQACEMLAPEGLLAARDIRLGGLATFDCVRHPAVNGSFLKASLEAAGQEVITVNAAPPCGDLEIITRNTADAFPVRFAVDYTGSDGNWQYTPHQAEAA